MQRSNSDVSDAGGISHMSVQEIMRRCPSADYNLVQDAVIDVLKNVPVQIIEAGLQVMLNYVVGSVLPILDSESAKSISPPPYQASSSSPMHINDYGSSHNARNTVSQAPLNHRNSYPFPGSSSQPPNQQIINRHGANSQYASMGTHGVFASPSVQASTPYRGQQSEPPRVVHRNHSQPIPANRLAPPTTPVTIAGDGQRLVGTPNSTGNITPQTARPGPGYPRFNQHWPTPEPNTSNASVSSRMGSQHDLSRQSSEDQAQPSRTNCQLNTGLTSPSTPSFPPRSKDPAVEQESNRRRNTSHHSRQSSGSERFQVSSSIMGTLMDMPFAGCNSSIDTRAVHPAHFGISSGMPQKDSYYRSTNSVNSTMTTDHDAKNLSDLQVTTKLQEEARERLDLAKTELIVKKEKLKNNYNRICQQTIKVDLQKYPQLSAAYAAKIELSRQLDQLQAFVQTQSIKKDALQSPQLPLPANESGDFYAQLDRKTGKAASMKRISAQPNSTSNTAKGGLFSYFTWGSPKAEINPPDTVQDIPRLAGGSETVLASPTDVRVIDNPDDKRVKKVDLVNLITLADEGGDARRRSALLREDSDVFDQVDRTSTDSSNSGWTCERCEFRNYHLMIECELCTQPK